MSIRIAGQVIASAGSLTAHNHDAEAHPDIRALIEQGGGGAGPVEGTYTEDNLVGGTDIELVKEVVGGGQIDNDTILMLNLDGNAEDSSFYKGELSFGDASGWTYGEGKFGQMALSGNAISIADDNNTLFNAVDKVTVDYNTFFSANASDTAMVRVITTDNGADVYVYAYYYNGKILEAHINGSTTSIDTTNIDLEQYLQISYEISEGKVVVFINGNPVLTKEDSNIKMGTGLSGIQVKPPTSGNAGLDEVRVSKCLRYNGQPFEILTQPYGPATETGRTLVNYVGGTSEGVYTEENLIGGKGVEIVPEATGGGKDEHAIALWHLDTDVIDSVNGIALGYPSQISTTENGIFGGCITNYANTHANDISVLGLTSSDSWTMDFWLKYKTYQSSGIGDYGLGSTFYGTSNALTIGFYRYELRLSGIGWGDARNTTIKDFAGISTPWYHMAIQYDAENKIGSVFVDGEPVYEGAVTIADGDLFSHMALQNGPGVLFDEIRISNTLRYSGKFTPPIEPYSEPVLTGRSFINNTAGKNVGEVFYSQSNSASDNVGALPLFTGETIANADALYPEFFSWVSSHSELQTTAEEYEAELLSRGDCNKYVVDGTSVRLPKKTLDKRYLIESKYPTETDSSWYNLYSDGWIEQGGRVSSATENADFVVTLTKPMLNNRYCIQRTSASASTTTATFRAFSVKGITTTEFKMYITDTISPTYWYVCGQSSITPQDKVDYPWVQAYNYAVPASSAQAAEFQNALSGKADNNLGNIPANYDYVYGTFNQEAGTTAAASWWRIYRSGWIEQGGTTGNATNTETITFAKPFARVPFIYCFCIAGDNYVKGVNVTSASATSFTLKKTTEGGTLIQNRINWFACGQGV